MTDADFVVARLGSRQLGLATRPQLLAGGLTRRQVDGRIGSGGLVVVHENVYRLPSVKPTFEQAVLAACLATGGVASHRCAARLFRLRGFERHPQVEICVDRPRAPILDGVVAIGPRASNGRRSASCRWRCRARFCCSWRRSPRGGRATP